MKKIAKLRTLPFADQKHIFNLCGQFSYPDVAAQLAKPRDQGGLDLETNPSALCRFNQQYSFLAMDSEILQQFVDVLKIQPTAEALSGPIVQMAEMQIFRQLINNVPFKQLLPEMKVLLNYKHAHLQEKKLNRFQRPFRRPEWWETDGAMPTNSDEVARGSCRADSPTDQGQTEKQFVNPAVQTSLVAESNSSIPSEPVPTAPPSSNITPFPAHTSTESPIPTTPPAKPSVPPSANAVLAALARITAKKSGDVDLPKIDQQTVNELLARLESQPGLTPGKRNALAQEIQKMGRDFTSCTKLHDANPPAA